MAKTYDGIDQTLSDWMSDIVVDVRRASDSCGYGVPLMTLEGHRPTMDQWSSRKGRDGIRRYWAEKNVVSIDGLSGIDPPAPQ